MFNLLNLIQYSSSLKSDLCVEYQVVKCALTTVSQTNLSLYVTTWHVVKQINRFLVKQTAKQKGLAKFTPDIHLPDEDILLFG